jgi:hypothetical protein
MNMNKKYFVDKEKIKGGKESVSLVEESSQLRATSCEPGKADG